VGLVTYTSKIIYDFISVTLISCNNIAIFLAILILYVNITKMNIYLQFKNKIFVQNFCHGYSLREKMVMKENESFLFTVLHSSSFLSVSYT